MERRVDAGEVIGNSLNRFLDYFFELFSFEVPFSLPSDTGMIAAIFLIVAVVIAAVAAHVFIRTRLNSRVPVRHALADIFEEMKNHTVAELLELSNCENRRVAVRYKYIAVILALNEKNIIVIEPSATNAIILKQIKSAAPEFAEPFSQITEVFHYTWFGHKILGDENFDVFNSAVSKVIRHAQ
jgi:hypothetical protein